MNYLYQFGQFGFLVIAVVSVARMARLLTHDTWPPVEWARPRVAAKLGPKWSDLVICPFCLAPWLMAGQVAWFSLLYPGQGQTSDAFLWGWLIPNLWWAASYVSAIVVAYDQPED